MTTNIEYIGWASALILLATLAQQVWRQWQKGSSEGVSRWLFVGQVLASLGFVTYSALVGNWVFVATNVLVLLTAVAGAVVTVVNRRRRRGSGGAEHGGLAGGAEGGGIVHVSRREFREGRPHAHPRSRFAR